MRRARVGIVQVIVLCIALPVGAAAQAGGSHDAGNRDPGHAAVAHTDTTVATVVLLHGLGRTHRSMRPVEHALEKAGYRVLNLAYPSREHTIPALADSLGTALTACCAAPSPPIHFVTHSLGGIVLRRYVADSGFDRLGRVVMLSPPNRGSEVVDQLPDGLLELLMGPAVLGLGTDSASVPAGLPPVPFELGVITGDASFNPLFSWWLPGEDDGKVTVESAWVEGTDDFLVVPHGHTFIMRHDDVTRQIVAFIQTGAFEPAANP